MTRPWSSEDIKARIMRRLGEAGKTLDDLPAGVRKGFEAGRWQNGPTYRTLQTTADILGITVLELLGGPSQQERKWPPHFVPPGTAEHEPNEEPLATALKVAIDMLVPADAECPLQLELGRTAEIACIAYSMLSKIARQRPDLAYSNDGQFVLSIIRRVWNARDSEKL